LDKTLIEALVPTTDPAFSRELTDAR
jgi:hypothetical protein